MRAIHMAGVTGILLLALLVVLAGLYMLAHSKKESLNKFYSISALVAVIFASSVFVFGVAGGIMCMACGKCKDGKENRMRQHMMMMHRMHGMGGPHAMMGGGCPMSGDCDQMECGGQMFECRMEGNTCKMRGGRSCDMSGCKDKCEGGGMKKEIIIEVDSKDGKKTETKTEVK